MKIKQAVYLACLVILLMNSVQVVADEIKVVPVYEEPRHRLVFAKDDVKIINVSVPPGDTTLYHLHANPTVYVVFSGPLVRLQTLGEDWVQIDPEQMSKPGEIVYREDYLKKPLTHRAENTGDIPFQVLGMINQGPGNGSSADSRVDVKPELATPWFRVYRFNLAGKHETEVHRHQHPVVVVQVNNGNSVVEENGSPTAEKTVGGTWSWHGSQTEHTLKNIGDTGVALIEIEVIK